MAENTKEFNILGGTAASFAAALPSLAGVPVFSLPVSTERYGELELNTLAPAAEAGRGMLRAYADASLCPSPFVKYPPYETALTLLHAPRHDLFGFYPAGSPSPLKASRADVSLLAGYILAGGRPSGPPLTAAAAELAAGNLYKAHYFASLAGTAGAAAAQVLCPVLIELGFFQEAYDLLKAQNTPEACLLLAMIHRRTGGTKLAEQALAAIPAGSPLESRKAVETAWLKMDFGAEDEAVREFRRLSALPQVRTEALGGLGAALAKKASATRDTALLSSAITALEQALAAPCPEASRFFFQLGNVYFLAGNFPKAQEAYARTASVSPGLQALGNLAAAMMRNGKFAEAANIIIRMALTEPAAAKQLAAQLPGSARQSFSAPRPQAPASLPARRTEIEIENFPTAPAAPQQPAPAAPAAAPSMPPSARPHMPAAAQPPGGLLPASLGPAETAPPQLNEVRKTLSRPGAQAPAAFGKASLEPAITRPPQAMQMESLGEAMKASVLEPREARGPRSGNGREDFISGAFRLASALEGETGGAVRFSAEGLEAVERKLRNSVRTMAPEAARDLVAEAAAFLCYFLQERYKGRLLPQPGSEPWGWPMVFEKGETRLTTYPAQRAWRLLWEEEMPERGWLGRYAGWLEDSLDKPAVPLTGAEAVRNKKTSHQEKLADTAAEHRRMLVLAGTLGETSAITPGRQAMPQISEALRASFKPGIPPTADGWRLLRCFGHLLAETLARDFGAAWYNTDGEDGGWSMRLPWQTFVFPIGKIFRTAALREDLSLYYDALAAEKQRFTGAQ